MYFYAKHMLKLYPSTGVWGSHQHLLQIEGWWENGGGGPSSPKVKTFLACCEIELQNEKVGIRKRDLKFHLIQPHHFTNGENVKTVCKIKVCV